MSTPTQIAANLVNSKLSTGPLPRAARSGIALFDNDAEDQFRLPNSHEERAIISL